MATNETAVHRPDLDQPPEERRGSIAPRVFWPAAAIITLFVALAVSVPEHVGHVIGLVQTNIIGAFGWYYVALVTAFVVFAIWMGASHFGDIKLGKPDEKPEFSMVSWLTMLFSAGMGIGLVFYGVAEPLTHFSDPKPGVTGDRTELGQEAMIQTFLHWGLHPWAIYVVIGLAIAYAVHRKGRPVSIRWALEPLLGDRVKGRLGDAIDVTAIVGTLFGVATSLGLGVLQVAAGLGYVGVAESSTPLHIVLICVITGFATLSVVSGLGRGIKWLSNLNIGLFAVLLVFVLVAGPTLFLLREYVQSVGLYLQEFIRLSFDVTGMQRDEGELWQGTWTTFYWGWWMSWAPFVGVFIARISRGRTVREFVAGVLLVPTTVTFLWFTVLGGTALHRELFGERGLITGGEVDTEGSLFGVLGGLPAGTVVSVAAIVLIISFFVTSSDSGSLVVDMLASGGDPEPPTWSRIFWAVLEGAVAIALLLAGGLKALQTMAIVIALPFSLVLIAMAVANWREFHAERQAWLRVQRRRQAEELALQVSENLIADGLIEEPAGRDDGDGVPRQGRPSD